MKMTVREWRRHRELTQQKVADALGVNINTIAKWERHPDKIPIKKVYDLAAVLGIGIEQIIIAETLQNVGQSNEI